MIHRYSIAAIALIFAVGIQSAQAQFGIDIQRLIEQKAAEKARQQAAAMKQAGGGQAGQRAAKGKRYAVVVAVSEYSKSKLNGDGIDADIDDLVKALHSGGYEKKNVTVLRGSAATRNAILASIRNLVAKANSNDVAFVYFVGHGVTLDGVNYFCPADATDEAQTNGVVARNVLVNVASIATQLGEPSNDNEPKRLAQIMEARVSQVLFVVDACRVAGAKGQAVKAYDKAHDGVWMINSCSDGQVAEFINLPNDPVERPVFTHFFQKGISGAADLITGNNDGQVSVFEAYSYAMTATRDEVKQKNKEITQVPKLLYAGASFPIVIDSGVNPRWGLTSEDPETERTTTAILLGESGNRVVQSGERLFQAEFTKEALKNEAKLDLAFEKQHNHMRYALATYIGQSQTFDESCEFTNLSLGAIHRSCGNYEQAVHYFKRANHPMALFVTGTLGTERNIFEKQELGNKRVIFTRESLDALLTKVPLYAKPTSASPMTRIVRTSMRVDVNDIHREKLPGGDKIWLQVVAVDSKRQKQPGWIEAEMCHWSSAAADLYAPNSDDNINDKVISALLQAQLQASQAMDANQQIRNDIAGLNKAIRVLGILQNAGIPGVGVGLARQIVATVRAAIIAKLQAQRNPMTERFVLYQQAIQQAKALAIKQRKLLEKKPLVPKKTDRIAIKDSPWQLAQ